MKKQNKTILLILLAGVLCSCLQRREEDKLNLVLKDMERLVERKDSQGLLTYLSEDYLDFEDNNKQSTAEMLEEYFRRYRAIVVHMLGRRINLTASDQAEVQLEVSLSSGAAEAMRRLFSSYGECYRFHLDFSLRGKNWLIKGASWEHLPRENLLPESLELLEKILGSN